MFTNMQVLVCTVDRSIACNILSLFHIVNDGCFHFLSCFTCIPFKVMSLDCFRVQILNRAKILPSYQLLMITMKKENKKEVFRNVKDSFAN